jgi:hypothetical protein
MVRPPGFRILAPALAALLLCMPAAAQTLYASSLRTYSDPGYKGVEGNIYVVDLHNTSLRLLSSLHVGDTPIGIDGLAIHPRTGAFYGITAPTARVIPQSLVSVDPRTGDVVLIGKLGHAGSDIVFDADGTLYIWLSDTRQVGTVDLDTGRATPRGSPLAQAAAKGGLTLVGKGRALIAATGGTGTLDTVDLTTGVVTKGPPLVGAPFPDLVNSLAYSTDGVLYGINTNFGGTARADLVIINPQTGKVSSIGPLPDDTDALAFGPPLPQAQEGTTLFRQWRLPVLVLLIVVAAGFILWAVGSKKS